MQLHDLQIRTTALAVADSKAAAVAWVSVTRSGPTATGSRIEPAPFENTRYTIPFADCGVNGRGWNPRKNYYRQ